MKAKALMLAAMLTLLTAGCDSVENDNLPAYPVNVVLADAGTWNTYGVAGFGSSRKFILSSSLRQPSGFPFSQTSATGFGGVLLINGMDPYSGTTDTPLAYDLACPVERKPGIRIEIEGDLYEAVCPQCGSHYDVTMGGGAPISGPAAQGSPKRGLTRYRCVPSGSGGFIITN